MYLTTKFQVSILNRDPSAFTRRANADEGLKLNLDSEQEHFDFDKLIPPSGWEERLPVCSWTFRRCDSLQC